MGEEWEQTLCAMGEDSSFSNPVQRYGESMIRANILMKKCNEANRTKKLRKAGEQNEVI